MQPMLLEVFTDKEKDTTLLREYYHGLKNKMNNGNKRMENHQRISDILFDFYNGIAKITINRPRYRNAFTPTTTSEISDALYYCRECQDINVVVLTGAGDKAFCSGEICT